MEKNGSRKRNASLGAGETFKEGNFQFLGISARGTKWSGVLKLVCGILLLPFVYATTQSFIAQFASLGADVGRYFSSGIIAFLVIHLFVWEAQVIYKKGQRFVEVIFGFFSPLVKIAPYLLPIYTIFLFAFYLVIFGISQSRSLVDQCIFLIGFSIAFHLVFTAQALINKQSDYLKGNYIFGFSLIYVINIFLLSFGFNLIFEHFSFVNFANSSFLAAADVFKALFRQLFL